MILAGVFVGGRTPEIEWLDARSNASNLNTYTFTLVPLGVEHSSRLIVVGVSSLSTDSVTVNGVSASLVAVEGTGTELWQASVPTGTEVSIVVSVSPAASRCMIEVWGIRYLRSHTAITPGNSSGSPSASVSLSVPSRGVFVGYATANATIDWTGASENHESVVETVRFSGASGSSATASTIDVEAVLSGGTVSVVAAAWR